MLDEVRDVQSRHWSQDRFEIARVQILAVDRLRMVSHLTCVELVPEVAQTGDYIVTPEGRAGAEVTWVTIQDDQKIEIPTGYWYWVWK